MRCTGTREAGGFTDITYAGGFGHLQKGHGVAFGNLDNDGDQDLFEQMGGAFPFDAYGNVLYENPGSDHHWIVVRLVGRKANRFGVGARIEVRLRDEGRLDDPCMSSPAPADRSAARALQQEIGLGAAEAIESLTIVWPGSGTRQVFDESSRLDRVLRSYGRGKGVEEAHPGSHFDWQTRRGYLRPFRTLSHTAASAESLRCIILACRGCDCRQGTTLTIHEPEAETCLPRPAVLLLSVAIALVWGLMSPLRSGPGGPRGLRRPKEIIAQQAVTLMNDGDLAGAIGVLEPAGAQAECSSASFVGSLEPSMSRRPDPRTLWPYWGR